MKTTDYNGNKSVCLLVHNASFKAYYLDMEDNDISIVPLEDTVSKWHKNSIIIALTEQAISVYILSELKIWPLPTFLNPSACETEFLVSMAYPNF